MVLLKDNALSEYEKQRQEKIAKNQALLKELQLDAASAGLAPKPAPKQSASRPKKKPAPKIKQEDFGPRRTSARIQGLVADSEVAKRKAEEDHVAIREAERAKRQRRADDLDLGDIVVAGQSWDQSGNWLRKVGPANPYERTFDEEDVKKTSDKGLKELRQKMNGLELYSEFEVNRLKITPERVYCMGFHPTQDKPLVFAGDKLGNLGLFDRSQSGAKVKDEDDDGDADDDAEPAITTFKPHTRTISAIHFDPSQPQAIYTSAYDSSIRKLDLEKGMSTEVYAPSSTDADEPLSGINIPHTDPNLLYFTSLNGAFGIHDSRTSPTSSTVEILQLSEKKIGGFSIHPLHPHLLATASLDRTLKLWDLRKISGKGSNRLPALVAEHESKLSVSHAAFNSIGQIATTSYDDTIKLHNLPTPFPSSPSPAAPIPDFTPDTIVKHNNQTGRWVTILRPQWQAAPADPGRQKFVIGNMNRFVDVYAGTGEQLAQLGGDSLTAVPAVAVLHPTCDWVAGGTASGKLALWM